MKIDRRKDLKSKVYYINGTFNYKGIKKVIKNKSTHTTNKVDAKAYLDWYEEQLKNEAVGFQNPDFKFAADKKMKDTFKPTSLKTDNFIKKIVYHIGDIKLRNIDNEFIRDLGFKMYPLDDSIKYAADTDLSEQEKLKRSSRLNTINRCVISPISLVLHYGAKQNPKWCDYMVVDRFKLIDRPSIYFTYEEFDKCLEINALFQIKLLLVFLCYTGARLQEALNTKWSDIKDGKVHIWEGKGDKPREVYIHDRLKSWLNRVNDRGIYIFQWRKAWDNKKDSEGLYFNWREMLRNANVPLNKLPHKCRHTFATWGRKAGWTLEDLQEIGGWKDKKSVEVYAHIMPETKVSRIMELPNDQKISNFP